MATEYLREKINTLNNLLQQFSLEQYQNQLIVDDASVSSGDLQIDQQMAAMAQNAKGVVQTCQRRIDVRKAELTKLNAELAASTPIP